MNKNDISFNDLVRTQEENAAKMERERAEKYKALCDSVASRLPPLILEDLKNTIMNGDPTVKYKRYYYSELDQMLNGETAFQRFLRNFLKIDFRPFPQWDLKYAIRDAMNSIAKEVASHGFDVDKELSYGSDGRNHSVKFMWNKLGR